MAMRCLITVNVLGSWDCALKCWLMLLRKAAWAEGSR